MSNPKRITDMTDEDWKILHSIVKPYKTDPKTGRVLRWKGIEKARKHFGVSDETVRNWLEQKPSPPIRAQRIHVKPKEEIEFEKTQAWSIIKGAKYEGEIKRVLIKAWEYTGKIDPATWLPSHVKAMRESEYQGRQNPLYTPITKNIKDYDARDLRRFIRLQNPEDKEEKIAALEDVAKAGTGKRKEWYLDQDGINLLIDNIQELDTLVFTAKCLEDGSRPIATAGKKDSFGKPLIDELRFTRDKIDEAKKQIRRWETKKGTYAVARYSPECIALILQYCADRGITEGDVLPRTQDFYSHNIITALKKAKIYRKGIGAYILRHTFATQALRHQVDLDAVAYQGGWLTTDIIKTYYAGLDEEKLDWQFQGIKPKSNIPWSEWLKPITKHFKDRYEDLKRLGKPLTRGYDWKAIEGFVKSPKTKPAQKRALEIGLVLHQQGLSDDEIRQRLGWK